jgi:exopolysaccharide biosynthesis polyprenyl glycosylphosphotransferase
VLFLLIPFGPILLELQGFYTNPLQKTLPRSLNQIARAALWLALLLAGVSFFLKLAIPSRAVLAIFAPISLVFLLARERLTVGRLKHRAKSGHLREIVLLAGTREDVKKLRDSLTSEELLGLNIIGELDIENEPVSRLTESLHRHSVSRVIFAGGSAHLDKLQLGIGACETEGVEAWLVADFIKTAIARPEFDVFGRRTMLVFRTTPAASWSLMAKRAVDLAGAALLLLLASPMMLFAAVVIKLTSPGPLIFRQTRAGLHGRPFTMYKFRSMHTDAEMRRSELEAFNEMSGPVFKMENDPRITRFGRWLRATSVDELPQLVNVLRGHMSLVGPRPLPIYEVEKFENTAQRRRLSVKPGLTCLWQVSGRNEVSNFQDWVRLDLEYIDNWSFWLDIKILLRTVPVVLFGFGAK